MHCLVLTTAPSTDEAEKIARGLVDGREAACVNIIPHMRSIYRWQSKIEAADECLLIIKTTTDRADSVYRTIAELHSYELPECITIEITDGSEPYLAWITESTR